MTSTFGQGTVFYAPNKMVIGENVYIGKYCSLETDIESGNDVLLGNNVGLIGKYDHDFSCIGKSVKDSSWIGYGSIVVSGVNIGHGAIVGAGSVVLKEGETYTIVAGNPAKVVTRRFDDNQIRELEKKHLK